MSLQRFPIPSTSKKPASHHGYEGWEALMETFNLPWWSLLRSGPSSMSWKITQFVSPLMLTPLPMSGHWLLLPYSLRAKLRLSRLCSALMNSCWTCQKPRSLKLKLRPWVDWELHPKFWSWSLQTKREAFWIQKSICWVCSSSLCLGTPVYTVQAAPGAEVHCDRSRILASELREKTSTIYLRRVVWLAMGCSCAASFGEAGWAL